MEQLRLMDTDNLIKVGTLYLDAFLYDDCCVYTIYDHCYMEVDGGEYDDVNTAEEYLTNEMCELLLLKDQKDPEVTYLRQGDSLDTEEAEVVYERIHIVEKAFWCSRTCLIKSLRCFQYDFDMEEWLRSERIRFIPAEGELLYFATWREVKEYTANLLEESPDVCIEAKCYFSQTAGEEGWLELWNANAEKAFHKINGMAYKEVMEKVKDAAASCVREVSETLGIFLSVEDVLMYGSRAEGKEHDGSDLNILISYSGMIEENRMGWYLDCLDERIGDVRVKYWAIRNRESGLVRNCIKTLKYVADRYEIYQIPYGTSAFKQFSFMPYSYLEDHGYHVEKKNYQSVYRGRGWNSLDDIYCHHQAGIAGYIPFNGHSLSVSDVIVTGNKNAWYVDDIGFRYLPDFLKDE